jgi:hypothetical protein
MIHTLFNQDWDILMEKFKIEHFKKDNSSKEFPAFNALTPDGAKAIYEGISRRIGNMDSRDHLVKIIDALGTTVKDINADSDDFALKKTFDILNIRPNTTVFVNWYHFDDIDEFSFVDLDKYFGDIWYPGSDDIDIFDATFSWIVSVSHYGSLKLLDLSWKSKPV